MTGEPPDGRRVPTRDDAAAVLARFVVAGDLVSLEPHTSGLINHSWLARFVAPEGPRRYLLQQINRHVFRHPEEVMENMARVTRHVALHLAREGVAEAGRRVLSLVHTREGRPHHRDEAGETWRLVPWIEGTRSTERAATEAEARETARAFGRFLAHLQDLPGPPLHETIVAFHDTPRRLVAFERAVATDRVERVASCRAEVDALLDRRALASALALPAERGEIPVRPTHNDAKIANVLFDDRTGEALCVVDLDTVMPGLSLHDFGDLARSGISDSDEDERDLSRVAVRVAFFEALARGFAEGAGGALSPAERSLLLTGAEVIVYEQAIRFLGDHLDGDRYYRTTRAGHNLDRARNQVRLLEELEARGTELRRIVENLA
ncbi:MAG TPA: aminoglycoside phosphotransferase family protein [Vicinamibacteria bacterium]|nr:aminoglycoside phosphotransferase family protein [Vicinamibacteria bacterium]